MNKDINTLYPNHNNGFDLSDFRVIARQPGKEISKKIKLAIIMYGVSVVITLICLIQVIQDIGTLAYQAHHQQTSNEINPANPYGIDPSTGKRIFNQ